MPSALPQHFFDVLQITNTGWVAFPVDPNAVIVNGDTGNNDMLLGLNNLGLNLNATVNGGGNDDRIDASGLTGLAALVPHTLNGGDGSDQIFGGGGIDVIIGGNGNDYIHGGAGADTLSGGAHDNSGGSTLGGDTLSYEFSNLGVNVNMAQVTLGLIAVSGGHATGDLVSNDFENVVGSALNDTITGNAGRNFLIGLGGNDTLDGGGEKDLLWGNDGDDTLIGGDGDDYIVGDAGNDILRGGAGADVLQGVTGIDTADYSTSGEGVSVVLLDNGEGFDGDAEGDLLISIENLTGSNFADVLQGDRGNNTLRGGAGNDEIDATIPRGSGVNNGGNDVLIGGAGADELFCTESVVGPTTQDRIVYENITDSRLGAFDTVHMNTNDKIDVSLIDANATAIGNQAFSWIGTAAFTGAGQLHYNAQSRMVEGNVDADLGVDFQIRLFGLTPTQDMFIL